MAEWLAYLGGPELILSSTPILPKKNTRLFRLIYSLTRELLTSSVKSTMPTLRRL
jgi:hypothetical protein